MDLYEVGFRVGLFFGPFLFALCFHEYAHGFVAKLKGDNTAEVMGRLSLNPLVHVDWFGTVLLPIAAIAMGFPLFGWAKPVPVNPRNLSNPKQDMFWIALAGPLSNLLLFVVGLFVVLGVNNLNLEPKTAGILSLMLQMFLLLNLYLAVFNMIPIHPLDGGKVIARFIPLSWNNWLEDNQNILNMVLLFLILMGGLHFLSIPVKIIFYMGWSLVVGGEPSII